LTPSLIPNASVFVVSTPQASGAAATSQCFIFILFLFVGGPAQQNEKKQKRIR
jgi:hypothetical protein